MKKQKRTIGIIVEINLLDGYYAYAQALEGGSAFFDYISDKKIETVQILINIDSLFILRVYDDVYKNERWKKICKLPIREDFQELPLKFIQDALNPERFELYNPNTGEIKAAKKEDCKGLERAAIWEADHVEDRLRDYRNGKENIWVKQLAIE